MPVQPNAFQIIYKPNLKTLFVILLLCNVFKCLHWQRNAKYSLQCSQYNLRVFILFNRKINRYKLIKCEDATTYLNTEVTSIYVVTEEEIPRVTGWSPHFKQLHKVKELAMDITTYCQKTNTVLLIAHVTTTTRHKKCFRFGARYVQIGSI